MHDVPRVTDFEFHKVRAELAEHGWTPKQRDMAELIFHDSLAANPHLPSWKPGIDKASAEEHLSFMAKHESATHLGPQHLEQLRSAHETYITHASITSSSSVSSKRVSELSISARKEEGSA